MKQGIIIIIMLTLSSQLWGEVITYEQALNTSLTNNTSIVNAHKDLTIAEAKVEQTYGMFDFKLKGNVMYSDRQTEATSDLAPEQTKMLSYGLGLSEKTMLGGFLNLDLNSSKTELFYPSAEATPPLIIDGVDISTIFSGLSPSINPTYNPTLSLRYEQPILKDFWGRPDQIALKIADYSIELAQIGLKQVMVDQISNLTNAFLGILQAEAMLKIQEESLVDTQNYYNQSVRMKKIGLREDKDIYQTQASYLKAKAGMSNANDGVKQAKEQFYNLAGYNEEKWLTLDISANNLFESFSSPQPLSASQEQQLVMNQHVIRLKELQTKMSEMNKKIADNATLPSLSLFGQYGIEGLDDGWGTGFSEMVDGKYNNYSVGINFSMNLPNRTFEGDQVVKKEDLAKAQADLKSLKKTLVLQVRYAYKKLLSSKEKYDLTKEARLLVEKSLTIHNRYFGQGRITTRELLGAQGEYHGTRMEEVTAMVEYLRAINEWKKLSGDYDSLAAKMIKE